MQDNILIDRKELPVGDLRRENYGKMRDRTRWPSERGSVKTRRRWMEERKGRTHRWSPDATVPLAARKAEELGKGRRDWEISYLRIVTTKLMLNGPIIYWIIIILVKITIWTLHFILFSHLIKFALYIITILSKIIISHLSQIYKITLH